MKSRQSHKPRGKRSKGTLRVAEGKRRASVGQTSRLTKQFASGIMGKYGWDRNNYLGMFALIFKGKGLTDKELAAIKNPSDRAWVLQLQLQLQSLKHRESAPLITKQQTIQHLQQLLTQSGYELPKHVQTVQQEQQSVPPPQPVLASTEKPKKKRGRPSKQAKLLESQLQLAQEQSQDIKPDTVVSPPATVNVVNKGNSPIIQRSMKQLLASIGMLAHGARGKVNQTSPTVNGVQHRSNTRHFGQKTLQLLYKQAMREGMQPNAKANHASVEQHVDAIRGTSVWLDQFQAGQLRLTSDIALLGTGNLPSAVSTGSQTQPSILRVAQLILREMTQTLHHQGAQHVGELLRLEDATVGTKVSSKLGLGPFSEVKTPSTVQFIRSLLVKHAEAASAVDSAVPGEQSLPRRETAGKSDTSVAKGFLAAAQAPLPINAASLTSRLPRAMHATASALTFNRHAGKSGTHVWRKVNTPEQRETVRSSFEVETITETIERLQQERDELRTQSEGLVESQSTVRIQEIEQSIAAAVQQQQALQHAKDQVEFGARVDGTVQRDEQVVAGVLAREQEQKQFQEQVLAQELSQKKVRRSKKKQLQEQEEQRQVLLQEQAQVQQQRELENVQMKVLNFETSQEQPVKRKRGRPRKNRDIALQPLVTVHETATEPAEQMMQESFVAKRLTDAAPAHKQERDVVPSRRIAKAVAAPSTVFRKPWIQGNGRAHVETIQSNEGWLQQLLTPRRQPPSNEPVVRSNHNVSRDSRQSEQGLFIAQVLAHGPDSFGKPSLASDVFAKPRSMKLSDETSIRHVISSVESTPFMQSGQILRKEQELQMEGMETLVSSKAINASTSFTPRKSVMGSMSKPEPQVHQVNNRLLASKGNPIPRELADQVAAKIAIASQRSLSSLLLSTNEQQGVKQGVIQRVLRAPLRKAESMRLKSTVNQEQLPRTLFSGEAQTPVESSRGTDTASFSAEIAAKVAQNSSAIVNPVRTAHQGSVMFQRQIARAGNLVETSSSVQTWQTQTPSESLTQTSDSAERSRLEVWKTAAKQNKVQADNDQEGRQLQKGTPINEVVPGKPIGRPSVEIIRRSGAPSRVERVRKQQGMIQRKIDAGQFASFHPQPSESLSRQGIHMNGQDIALTKRGTMQRLKGQPTLRAGRIDNGVMTRRMDEAGPSQQHRVSVRAQHDDQLTQRSAVLQNNMTEEQTRVVDNKQQPEELRDIVRGRHAMPVQETVERPKLHRIVSEYVDDVLRVNRSIVNSNGVGIQRTLGTSFRQLINRATAQEIRDVTELARIERLGTSTRSVVNPAGAQVELLQRRLSVGSNEREPQREEHGSDSRVEAERFHTASAEQTIRAMVSAQVEQRAPGLEPAAASRAATATGARSARAPLARQSASMTPRVMPQLASPAGALRAAPARTAAASPAAAEHRLPALGAGSMTQAAASGRATSAAGSSQGTAAAAVKPLHLQVQRQAKSGDAPSIAAPQSIARSQSAMQAPMAPMRTASPDMVMQTQRLTAAPDLVTQTPMRTAAPDLVLPRRTASPDMVTQTPMRTTSPDILAQTQRIAATNASASSAMRSTTQDMPTQTLQSSPAQVMMTQAQLANPSRSTPTSQEHLASRVAMLEHKQAPVSQLAEKPVEMDWLRTKASGDEDSMPSAPVEQAPPELSEQQMQELVRQLPQLDIAKIADKVYREIEKKLRFERQRRGV
ncbi:hypothetical protein [Paenibacillus roseipurpureus]|uniref:Uncharacterized protein n=1 Tax=Paenibacillus roseopurpureus TaxID=2918901 RepID=A0AA96RI88_9BACL|nr:hypothetical protein [Paenibacillus sp. MBLB1832]WNR44088.1 hypothetical protein MJB10_23805 [Paenibacillus sp. MBLB1832]